MGIREAAHSDAKKLAAIAKNNLGEGFSCEDFISSINNSQMILLLFEKNTETFGYLAATFAADEGELIQIAVDKETRHCGIGKRLLQSLLNELKKRDVKSLFLEVRESNQVAKTFYKSFNFVEVGKRPGFYNNPQEDALIMRLDIDA